MTRRQAATIIGLLIIVVLGIALFGGSEDSQGQTPGQILGESSIVMPSGVVAGRHPSLGAYAFTTKGDGNLTEGVTPDPEMVEAMNKVLGVTLPPLIHASGKETSGSMIDVAGKSIQLPSNVHIDTYIAAGLCPLGVECLDPPIYVLRNDAGVMISISEKNGKIGDPSLSAEELAQAKSSFQWLVDAVNAEVAK
jgi:hypothetical protein